MGRRGEGGGGENGQIGWRGKDWRSRPWLGKLGLLILIKKSKKRNDHPVVSHKTKQQQQQQQKQTKTTAVTVIVLNISCDSCTRRFVAGPTVTCKARPRHQVHALRFPQRPKTSELNVSTFSTNSGHFEAF